MATEPERTHPSEMPVLALRQTVVFPLTLQPLAINRSMSIETVNRALAGDRLVFLALQTNDKDEPEAGDLHTIGTIAAIRQMVKVPNGGVHVIVEGLMRAKAEVITRSGASLRGEILRTGFETAASTSVAYEWFVQGQQTLSPRWFVAARREGTSAPSLISGTSIGSRTDFGVFEATAGFRVTRDITLRSSYYARRFYGASTWTDQAGVSVVWAHRWW